VTEKEFNPEPV